MLLALALLGLPGAAMANEARVLRDIAYGDDPAQRLDVHLPATTTAGAPVIFMVHGGAWRLGDKAHEHFVGNKVARWQTRGLVVVSVNYRLAADVTPVAQAADVAAALVHAQRSAAAWGADAERFVLLGHSAGAHLVALLAAAPVPSGVRPWLGAVALDSGALDVVEIMSGPHLPLHRRAFGDDPAVWRAASPWHAVAGKSAPLLAVCSTQRRISCVQAERFATRLRSFGGRAEVLREDRSHRAINEDLGTPGRSTDAVEGFMASLDAELARRLGKVAGR